MPNWLYQEMFWLIMGDYYYLQMSNSKHSSLQLLVCIILLINLNAISSIFFLMSYITLVTIDSWLVWSLSASMNTWKTWYNFISCDVRIMYLNNMHLSRVLYDYLQTSLTWDNRKTCLFFIPSMIHKINRRSSIYVLLSIFYILVQVIRIHLNQYPVYLWLMIYLSKIDLENAPLNLIKRKEFEIPCGWGSTQGF